MATSPKSGEKTPDQQQLPAQKAQREPQDAAYARAQDAIATARTSDASDLTLSGDDFSDLTELPPDVGTLTALTDLSLSGTQVSDISALSGLTGLMGLSLSRTPVSDISALSGLTGLTWLYLSRTEISDISALSGLSGLTTLSLMGTPVSDISALSGLTALSGLSLLGTPVNDLSPILPLTQLVDAPVLGGLAFRNNAAAQADPRIAEIAEIKDNAKRATDLFAYLKNVNLTQTAQYHTLLSTRLMRASIGDFQFDSLARVMRLMPFEEDLRRLRDPVQLARFLEGAEDLCEGLQTLSTALKASSGNMYAAQITPYLDGVIDTLGRAE